MKQKVAKNNKEITEMEQLIKLKQRQIEKKIQDIQQNSVKNLANSPQYEKLLANKDVQKEMARLDKINGYNYLNKTYDNIW